RSSLIAARSLGKESCGTSIPLHLVQVSSATPRTSARWRGCSQRGQFWARATIDGERRSDLAGWECSRERRLQPGAAAVSAHRGTGPLRNAALEPAGGEPGQRGLGVVEPSCGHDVERRLERALAAVQAEGAEGGGALDGARCGAKLLEQQI